jgi:signal transduction histidine kinase
MGVFRIPEYDRLRHHGDVTVRGISPRTFALTAAALAAVANVIGASLSRDAVPYLSTVDVLTGPTTGLVFAAAAAFLAIVAPHRTAVVAVLGVAFATAAAPLALGLAQRSGLWVALGALAVLVVPAAALLAIATARGERGRVGRSVVAVASALAGVTIVVTVATYDPGGWGWCRCQPNPLALTDENVYSVLARWLGIAKIAVAVVAVGGATVELVRRPGRFGPPEAALTAGLAGVTAGWVAPQAQVTSAGLLLVLAVHLRAAMRHRPSRAHVADLLLEAREQHDPARLEELVARAIGDPGATVWWWDPVADEYRRAGHGDGGRALDIGASPRRLLRVDTEGRPIALVEAISHDLPRDMSVLDAVAEALRLSTENRRLTEELRHSLEQVRESRARIVTATDEARKRIERDLHDGTQQLLISTGVKLNLASAQSRKTGDPRLAETLAEASSELGRAQTELRRLAAGITPTALVHGNLRQAIEELAIRCPLPVTVTTQGATDPGQERSATAYFVATECLTNVIKHAGARSATVALHLGEPFVVTVVDDGRGGADPTAGSGLRGLADRVDASGGHLDVTSDDRGTRVSATIPQQVLS